MIGSDRTGLILNKGVIDKGDGHVYLLEISDTKLPHDAGIFLLFRMMWYIGFGAPIGGADHVRSSDMLWR